MNTINVENCKTLLIGRRGENEVTTVLFDFTEWASEFGSGVVDLYVKRFVDESAYPVVLTIDGTVASWLVTETDTNVAGYGKAEYVYRVDGKIAKSAVFPFFVAEDIGQPASEPPDPYESWLEQLTALGAETEAHAQAAEQSAENSAESAEDAAQSAASAEGYAGQAETAAGLAQAAQTASEAAMDAAQTAQASAESSATAASGSAASAAGSATAAAGSASDASSSASAAGASATAASASATTASNAATAAQTAQSAAEDAADDAQQAAQQAHVEYEQLSGEVDDLSDEVSQQKSAIEALDSLVDRKAGMLVDTASGAIASFVPDATIPNLLGLTVAIEPVQAGSGDPSPDNVRPISGWNSVEVKHSGADTSDPTTYTIALGDTVYGGTLDVTDGGAEPSLDAIDLGTATWSKISADSHIFGLSQNNLVDSSVPMLCSIFKPAIRLGQTLASIQDNEIAITNSAVYTLVRVRSNASNTLQDFLALCAGQKLVFKPKADLPTIQTAPTQIATIAGQTNNVWANAGDVSVEFAADVKTYIDQKIAAAVAAMS